MNNEIKSYLKELDELVGNGTSNATYGMSFESLRKILDYITNLQKNYDRIYNENCKLREEHNITDISLLDENERLKKISHKMHLWIFLHCGDEQKVYDELGLTDEENAMLGYSGQFRMRSDKELNDGYWKESK